MTTTTTTTSVANRVPFGQVVIGPPGSGKTTYCHGVLQYLRSIGRQVAVVNLDPANDTLPYDCAVSIEELVTLQAVTEQLGLGPNGGLMYCMEYLEKNMDWLKERLAQFPGHYFLFDCPGQAELYTHHAAVHNVVEQLGKWGYRVAAVHLVDSHHCVDPTKFISALLLSLQTMLRLDLPHVNVLSKVDLMEQYGQLAFDVEFYTEVMDLQYLLRLLDNDAFGKRYHSLNKALCELVEDFGLVSFQTLNIADKDSVHALLKVVDKANGYIYGYVTEPKDAYMGPRGRDVDPNAPISDDLIVKEHFDSLTRSMQAMDVDVDENDA